MATAAQAAASRVNGALSHGPTSEEGKATSSLNALKTGLTGRTVLLPSEDAALYEAHLQQFRQLYQPIGDQELALVQSLADTHWRIARIPSLEMGIFALGRLEFADLFPDYDEGSRKILIEAKTTQCTRPQSKLSLKNPLPRVDPFPWNAKALAVIMFAGQTSVKQAR
jgi:hypothetical protein